jgi:hypothetical protein
MPGDTLLLAIAQIAVVIAGFTAVTSVLQPPGGTWSPDLRIRHRSIVSTTFNVTFEALVPMVVFAALADARSSTVISSAGVALYAAWVVAVRGRQSFRERRLSAAKRAVARGHGPHRGVAVRVGCARPGLGRRVRAGALHPAVGCRGQLLHPRGGIDELRGRGRLAAGGSDAAGSPRADRAAEPAA